MAAEIAEAKNPLVMSLARLGEAVYRLDLATHAIEWISRPTGSPFFDSQGDRAIFATLGQNADRKAWTSSTSRQGVFEANYHLEMSDQPVTLRERLVSMDAENAIYGFLSDVSVAAANEERLTYLACFDGLTGHYTRSHLRAELARSVVKAFEKSESFCFAFIGLDEMATINRALGYSIADDVLCGIGDRIGELAGDQAIVGRAASSKFGVIFNGMSVESALERLHAIQRDIRENVIESSSGAVPTTVSIGVVEVPVHAGTTDQVFALAEDALTTAKDNGPAGWAVHAPDLKETNARNANLKMAEQISAALNEERIVLALQPIVKMDGTTSFYECLARMVDRVGNVIPAGEFMPVAEKLGFVRLIDRRVMTLAMEALAYNSDLRLSINVSPSTLFDASWHSDFARIARANPNAAQRLIVEITETAAIKDPNRVQEIIREIASFGARVAIDDFGAGYTSFSHFKSLTFDVVKIDGRFVRGICDSAENQVFVSALSQLAKHFEMMVVAEMVEDDEAAQLLSELGVDCMQGFHFGRPVLLEPDELQELRCGTA